MFPNAVFCFYSCVIVKVDVLSIYLILTEFVEVFICQRSYYASTEPLLALKTTSDLPIIEPPPNFCWVTLGKAEFYLRQVSSVCHSLYNFIKSGCYSQDYA